ncbi:MAG: aspartyl/glutamyl-tRNA amidotransferase subunit A [Elusimicrobia bacterium GWA2_56_46]|nr:MAG: aspartyl/glutamyl-tRNA amidotransferase subunit A [Elusimicrobia bacterium GWA2_56_46]OGR53981.1 MAG: aspartyl/glutamyl-tRNA amidotransferase subunit A [Elusimicrobia bacterium GWC2_56_31]HBW22090.1 Asp-tRNA(Asn)/Glu-tRNA(Gln) amidotransferase GatCAB subunit A [Elusimicrobiota bacterium]
MEKATEIVSQIKGKKITAVEVLNRYLRTIKEKDGEIRAFLEVFSESAAAQARAVDEKAAAGLPLGRLAGVPVAIKDNMLYKGHKASCASKILENYISPYTATAVQNLIDADAVIIGRTNMDEFAMGSSTENSAFRPTRNPADTSRVPGGSSGGSAAAVAAGMCPLALGSDTGGSVRQPAAFCGTYGLKPTYGSVSRYGLVAFASSLDQIGVFANSIEDTELAFSVISSHDPKDATSVKYPENKIPGGVKGLRIGLPKEYAAGSGAMDAEVARLFGETVQKLKELGAVFAEISLPHTRYALPAYYIAASSEASSNLGRFDGIRYGLSAQGGTLADVYKKTRGQGFGPEVKRRIMLGTYSLSAGYYDAYYLKAQKTRTLIKRDFDEAFGEVDVIFTPTTPSPAFRFGEKVSDPVAMYLSDIFTIPCNLAGLCGLSIPAGKSGKGLPIGAQFLAKPFNEAVMFKLGEELAHAG